MSQTPRFATPMTLTACVAVLLSVVLTLEGCSVAISVKRRIGPDPDRDFKEGATRAEVEGKLGEPIATQTLADGNVRAVYQYTARVKEKSYRPPDWFPAAEVVVISELYSLGLIELVFMPIAYFSKTKYTFQKEYVYRPDGTIVESSWECIQHQPTHNSADWCSHQQGETTVAEPVIPAPEDRPAAPAPGPEP